MTKIIALLLSLYLFAVPVFSDDYDFSVMSDDELNALYTAVIDEMHDRNMPISSKIYQGLYTVGVDIKPGKYVLKHEQLETDNDDPCICIYADEYKSSSCVDYYELGLGDEVIIDLKDGMFLEILDSPAIISTVPTSFWTVN